MNIKKLLKPLVLWVLTLFFAMSSLAFFPSLASLFSILIVALVFPLAKWQTLLLKYIKTGIRITLIVILFVLTMSTFPNTSPVDDVHNSPILGSSQTTLSSGNSATSIPTSSSTNTHTHQFQDATCTSPKTCTICGITEGTKAEHTWVNATCTSPKTCSVCGTTDGNTTGHNYTNGKCTVCYSEDPNYSSEIMVWIPTNGGERYHSKKTCSQMEDPEYVTKSEAISRGFTPCGRCKPS